MNETQPGSLAKNRLREYVSATPYSASAGALYQWLKANFVEITEARRRDAIWAPYIRAAREDGIAIEDDAKGRDRIRQAWTRVVKAHARNESGATQPSPALTEEEANRQRGASRMTVDQPPHGDVGEVAAGEIKVSRGATAPTEAAQQGRSVTYAEPRARRRYWETDRPERTPEEAQAYLKSVEDGLRRKDNERNGYFERTPEPPKKITYEK